jgi:UDP-2,3-diacylglucosamine hydrolase
MTREGGTASAIRNSPIRNPKFSVILFLSDLHFGQGDPATERAKETAVLDCLQAHVGSVERLYLLGDVFDAYIEYRHLIPKGFVRFQALLGEWTARGIPVTYLVGNHDPWHRDYFTEALGVAVRFHPFTEPLAGRNVYMAHGDGLSAYEHHYRALKRLLRHPIPVWLYRTLLGDLGFTLAQAVNRRYSDREVVPATVAGLRVHARQVLAEARAALVVMGHCHQPELSAWHGGFYLNLGAWSGPTGTFGTLDADAVCLHQWQDGQPHPLTRYRWDAPPSIS